jgi:hypothetical protein
VLTHSLPLHRMSMAYRTGQWLLVTAWGRKP